MTNPAARPKVSESSAATVRTSPAKSTASSGGWFEALTA